MLRDVNMKQKSPVMKAKPLKILTILLTTVLFILFSQEVRAQANAPTNPEIPTAVQVGEAAHGRQMMVVAAHPEATRVGMDILSRGGSAVDAAIAVEMVLGLVEPQSSGIGGGGFAVYYDAATKKIFAFDGRETAPAQAGPYLFRGEDGKPMEFYQAAIGGRAVGVPGVLRMMQGMHTSYGVLDWRDLMMPAITLSENGFIVTPRLAEMVDKDAMKLKNFSATKLYFFPDAANPVRAGDRLINPQYAKTLRKIAIEGADGFYKGDISERIVKAVREDYENPGLLSLEDFESYEALERKVLCGTYRAHKICSVGEPSSGGLSVLIALGILEKFNLAALGKDNPASWHLITEASRLAFADRNYYMADPHYVQSPGDLLLSPDYISERAALVSQDKPNPKIMPGVPAAWQKVKEAAPEPVSAKPPGTTHISIVDAKGNIVSMTTSVEDSFGSRMMVDGFLLNNQLTDFSFIPEADGKRVANRVEGGKRPRSSMAPMIVFAPNGAPKMVIGSAGGSAIIGYILQRIVSVIDWNMDIESAVAAPNIINRGKKIEMELGAANLAEPLRKIGHPVETGDLNSGITAIVFDANGMMTGYADPRREGTAAGR